MHKIEVTTPDPGYEPFPVSIMNRSTHEVATFDPLAGKPATISYSLNKAGCIRIRLVHRQLQSLVIRTLQDWTDQSFGKYQVQWDGRDASGNMVDNRKMFVLFEAKDRGTGRQHQTHSKQLCREPIVLMEPASGSLQAAKGEFKIQAGLHPDAPGFTDENGCEVRYYIDYKPLKTERIAPRIRQFVLTVDTSSLENGQHLLTINVDDFQGHVGTAGLKIDVEN